MLALAAGAPPERLLALRAASEGVPTQPDRAAQRAQWLLTDPYFHRQPDPPPGLRFMAGDAEKKKRLIR